MDYDKARDAMLTAFNDHWIDETNGPNALLGYVPEVRWQHRTYAKQPPLHLHYVEITVRTLADRRVTFRGPVDNGIRKRRSGILYVDYFFSRVTGRSRPISQLPGYGEQAFIRPVGDNDCILFRNVATSELANMEQWFRSRTTVNWEYDRIIGPIEVVEEEAPED